MTTQDLLEKMQWNINRAIESGLPTSEVLLILEAIKFKIVEAAIKPAPEMKIVKANSIPGLS